MGWIRKCAASPASRRNCGYYFFLNNFRLFCQKKDIENLTPHRAPFVLINGKNTNKPFSDSWVRQFVDTEGDYVRPSVGAAPLRPSARAGRVAWRHDWRHHIPNNRAAICPTCISQAGSTYCNLVVRYDCRLCAPERVNLFGSTFVAKRRTKPSPRRDCFAVLHLCNCTKCTDRISECDRVSMLLRQPRMLQRSRREDVHVCAPPRPGEHQRARAC